MKIEQMSPYLSITGLQAPDLPNFTLITGVNGVGKTHLLRGVQGGHLVVDAAPDKTDVRYFDWNSLNPGGPNEIETAKLYSARDMILKAVRKTKADTKQDLLKVAVQFGLHNRVSGDVWELLRLTSEDLGGLLPNRLLKFGPGRPFQRR